MFNFHKSFKVIVFIITWILLQLSENFNCYGYLVSSTKRDDTTKAPTLIPTLYDDVKQESSILNETQADGYRDTSTHQRTFRTTNLLRKCQPCPEGILCVPQIQCPAHVRMREQDKPQVCDLAGSKFGFCCVSGQNHTGISLNRARVAAANLMPLHVLKESHIKFQNILHQMAMLPTAPGHPDFVHGFVFHSSPKEDVKNFHLTNLALKQILATQVFAEEEQIPLDDIITNNIKVGFQKTPLDHSCQSHRPCANPQLKYRSFDGSCNNPHPSRSQWGSAGQPMERLLPPAYEDGIWTPRQHGKDGSLLTNARKISQIVMSDADRPHPKHNLLLMQFGQFLAHDVSQSAVITLENGELVQCCAPNNIDVLPPEGRHFACFPIKIDPNDEFYSIFGVGCMNLVRLSLAPNTECRAGYGKQRNKVTHYIDASQVYGSSFETVSEMRAFKGGRLRMFNDFGRELLPLTNEEHACDSDAPGRACFKSGDGRTNQIISLIVMHILFAREHNRIADILARLNPHASDELLYQEARRIVIAEIQHIVYNEYLPVVVGPMQMKRFRLATQQHGYSSDYNGEVNPGITNEFAGAAFRMGHSSVDGHFRIQQAHGGSDEIIHIPDVMFNPSRMRQRTFYDDILKTMLIQPMQKVDSAITHGLSRNLFRGHSPFGLDLSAINIQRGRDQGLRSYNDYLELMGNRRILNFSQLPVELNRKLSQVYRSPDDIDLWVGGLLEQPVAEGIVGTAFAEIIADQFSRLKQGDRYYYEYNKSINPGAFNTHQLREIRKITMARIICNNADHFTLNEVPPMAFVRADIPGNHPLRCDSSRIPTVDLKAWRL